MKGLVVYGSIHGTAKGYVEELARLLGFEARDFKEAADSRAMVEAYGQRVDFTDFSTLVPVVEAVGLSGNCVPIC